MKIPFSCDNCGSAGSIEFCMCQVCYKDYPDMDKSFLVETERLLEEAESITINHGQAEIPHEKIKIPL